MSGGRNTLNIRCDTSGIKQMIDSLGTEVNGALRPAAEAGARVVYEAVQRNVDAMGRKTGNLRRAIYEAYSKDNSGNGRETYHVSWNARKAPHGHLLEYGHIQRHVVFIGKDGQWHTDKSRPLATPRHVAARPFVRPAASAFPAAIAAMEAELLRRLQADIATGG